MFLFVHTILIAGDPEGIVFTPVGSTPQYQLYYHIQKLYMDIIECGVLFLHSLVKSSIHSLNPENHLSRWTGQMKILHQSINQLPVKRFVYLFSTRHGSAIYKTAKFHFFVSTEKIKCFIRILHYKTDNVLRYIMISNSVTKSQNIIFI